MKSHRDVGTIMDPATMVKSPGINRTTDKGKDSDKKAWYNNGSEAMEQG